MKTLHTAYRVTDLAVSFDFYAALEHLDDAPAGQVQVVTGVAVGAVRKVVEREQEHKSAGSVPCTIGG